jgi:hypothetical protein
MGDFSKTIIFFYKKKLLCAFVCVSLGLKKSRDFTVSEGHGYPLVFLKHKPNDIRINIFNIYVGTLWKANTYA